MKPNLFLYKEVIIFIKIMIQNKNNKISLLLREGELYFYNIYNNDKYLDWVHLRRQSRMGGG